MSDSLDHTVIDLAELRQASQSADAAKGRPPRAYPDGFLQHYLEAGEVAVKQACVCIIRYSKRFEK